MCSEWYYSGSAGQGSTLNRVIHLCWITNPKCLVFHQNFYLPYINTQVHQYMVCILTILLGFLLSANKFNFCQRGFHGTYTQPREYKRKPPCTSALNKGGGYLNIFIFVHMCVLYLFVRSRSFSAPCLHYTVNQISNGKGTAMEERTDYISNHTWHENTSSVWLNFLSGNTQIRSTSPPWEIGHIT